MNELERFLIEREMSAVYAIDALQDSGIISDNCVSVRDVAECDIDAAILFLSC